MYEELIAELREEAEWAKANEWETPIMLSDHLTQAADAIEKLLQKEKFHAFLWNTIQPNEMEQYISMYNSGNIPQKPPKEKT